MNVIRRSAASFCPFSIGVALTFFALMLTPSLIPRPFLIQGVLSGIAAAIGYVAGRSLLWLVNDFLEIPVPPRTIRRRLRWSFLAACSLAMIYALARANAWQNSVRVHVGMEPQPDYNIALMALAALFTFVLLIAIGRGVVFMFNRIRKRLYSWLPRRVANLATVCAVSFLLFVVLNNWIKVQALSLSDKTYSMAQQWISPERPPPEFDWQAGSAASLLNWGEIGQPGRQFISQGPQKEDIAAATGQAALDPLRIYVGYASADDAEARAQLALSEMLRVGAFERSTILIVNPTGTGWVDPAFHDVVEYLEHGDIATIIVQYSYLSSAMTQMVEPDYAVEQAGKTFDAIFEYWSQLPPESRPKLYLHGLSLGAWSGMESFDLFRTIDHPIDGILWAGPPFNSSLWKKAMESRDDGSAYVMPIVGDGRVVRFMNQNGLPPDQPNAPSRKMKAVYLQYASDPIVFFSPDLLYREPPWLKERPAHDVSPLMRWIPIVTFIQVAMDMALSKSVAEGFGHNYLADDYISAWLDLAQPEGWTQSALLRLREHCSIKWGAGCANGQVSPPLQPLSD